MALARVETREHVLNVLFHVSACLPASDALAVWESALRLRRVSAAELSRVAWRSAAAAAMAAVAHDLSDSGVETIFVDTLRRAGIPSRQQVWIDGHPVDNLIGETLVTQLDGFAHHSSARDRRRDLADDARLTLRGFTVLRFDYDQVLFQREAVIATIRMAMAQNLHRTASRAQAIHR